MFRLNFSGYLNRALLLSVVLLSGVAAAQVVAPIQREEPTTLRMRVLDSHTFLPIKNQSIQLTFTDMKGDWIRNGAMLKGRIGKDGVAIFGINKPVPPRVGIFV